MKYAAALSTLLTITLFASLGFSPNRRAHDHIGNFNFRVEIDVTNGSMLQLEATKEQPSIKCGSPKNTAFIFDFESDLSKEELDAFLDPKLKQIMVFDKDDAVVFGGLLFDAYQPSSKGGPRVQMSTKTCQ